MENFSVNNLRKYLGFVNSKKFLRKHQLFYTSLNSIVFSLTVFTT